MFVVSRVCLQCQSSNLKNVLKIVYGTSRSYKIVRRPHNSQLGAYLKPLLFTTAVCDQQARALETTGLLKFSLYNINGVPSKERDALCIAMDTSIVFNTSQALLLLYTSQSSFPCMLRIVVNS